MNELTQKRLKELLHYEPKTGVWTRLVTCGGRGEVGKIAGNKRHRGWRFIKVDYKAFKSARLAFLYMVGRWPEEIDHINRIRDDDRWENLRECTRSLNCSNQTRQRLVNPHLPAGVSKHRRQFRARCTLDGKKYHVGLFATPKEAHEAYISFRNKLHGVA